MSQKPGCILEVILNCYDEKGELISQTDSDWYSLERQMLNAGARDILDRIKQATMDWEQMRGGTPPGDGRRG